MPPKLKDPSTPSDLDRIDRRILQLLQRDGRMSNADIAKAAHVSAATCHRRTQRLFEAGYIKAVRAEIAPEKVGRGALVIVGVVDRAEIWSKARWEAFEKEHADSFARLDSVLLGGGAPASGA